MTAPTSQMRDHVSLPRKRKILIGRIGRILLVLVMLLALLVMSGLLYQGIATHNGHDIVFKRPDLVIAAIKQVATGQKM